MFLGTEEEYHEVNSVVSKFGKNVAVPAVNRSGMCPQTDAVLCMQMFCWRRNFGKIFSDSSLFSDQSKGEAPAVLDVFFHVEQEQPCVFESFSFLS